MNHDYLSVKILLERMRGEREKERECIIKRHLLLKLFMMIVCFLLLFGPGQCKGRPKYRNIILSGVVYRITTHKDGRHFSSPLCFSILHFNWPRRLHFCFFVFLTVLLFFYNCQNTPLRYSIVFTLVNLQIESNL